MILDNILNKQKENKGSISTLDNIKEEVLKANKIGIFTHENPDGDAIGSACSVYLVLKKLNKDVYVYCSEVPDTFKFLDATSEFTDEKLEDLDLAISLDCTDLNRLDGFRYFEKAKKTIMIDHHVTNQMFGDINYVDPLSPANCQILVRILTYFGVDIKGDIADALMTGIITDTGGFQYEAVGPETFELAAELLRSGINISKIYKEVMATKSLAQFNLSKRAIDNLEFLEDGKIAFTYITNKDLEEFGAKQGDTEGIVDIGREVKGVEVSILLKQDKEDEEKFKISTRSNEYVDVSKVCNAFGGGGHIRAAGAKAKGSIEQLKEKVVNEIKKQLK